MRILVVLLGLAWGVGAFGATTVDEDWRDAERGRTVPVRLRIPDGQGPFPVLLLSHGLGGSRRGIGYLAEAACEAGWLCVSMQHPGSDEDLWRGKPPAQILVQLKVAISTPQPALARLGDVGFVLDELARRQEAEGSLQGKLALRHVALAGHSFGAWTAMAAAGRRSAKERLFAKSAKTPQPESRLRAIVALSPQGEESIELERAAVANLKIPSLSITGGKDTSPIQPEFQAIQRRYSFDALPEAARPGYLLWFNEADHMVFGGSERDGRRRRGRGRKAVYDEKVQAVTSAAVVSFLRREVLGKTDETLLTDPKRAAALVGDLGHVETKLESAANEDAESPEAQ